MSVEPCIIRVTPHEFGQLQKNPEALDEFIDDGYETGAFSFDWSPNAPPTRMLHLDEFAMSLLTGFDDDSPLCRALVGWDSSLLEGASHGHGGAYYHTPERVSEIAEELESLPEAHLRERLESRAENFRLVASGFLDGDEAIRSHQRDHFYRLRSFYREAAGSGDYILLMMV
ncbi:MAG: YfbM family protein [Acidobacteria bacterium]|nr:YfbM family protein [Acidobacteriota bacterium]